eukprot:UN03763
MSDEEKRTRSRRRSTNSRWSHHEQLKSSLLNDGLSRGLREVVKAIESGNAHLCFLAEDCNSAEYKQLITALCKSRSVDLLKVR